MGWLLRSMSSYMFIFSTDFLIVCFPGSSLFQFRASITCFFNLLSFPVRFVLTTLRFPVSRACSVSHFASFLLVHPCLLSSSFPYSQTSHFLSPRFSGCPPFCSRFPVVTVFLRVARFLRCSCPRLLRSFVFLELFLLSSTFLAAVFPRDSREENGGLMSAVRPFREFLLAD